MTFYVSEKLKIDNDNSDAEHSETGKRRKQVQVKH